MIGRAYGMYAFLHARLGALKGEQLRCRQWQQLLGAGTFAEQQRLLESTRYAAWLQAAPEATLTSIPNVLHRTARKMERSVLPQAGRFLRMWGRRDLLRNLKTILKGKALGRPEEEIRSDLLELETMELLPTEALLRCANVEAALDLVETTDLRHWIRAARRIYQREPTLFGLDAALDRVYYPELWQQVKRLDPADRAAVEDLVALEIDQVNLLWLLRYRLNYRLSPAETYYLLVPVTGRVTAAQLKELVRQESLAAMAASLTVEPWRALLAPCASIWQVEVALWRYRARHARRMLTQAVFTLGEALALLILIEIEIRDLVAVLEGIRLGASRRDIDEQLASVWPP